jgi:hypothetical protein
LQVDAADSPAAGATFANVLSSFASTKDRLDLAGIAFASGATATSGTGVLKLSEGGEVYRFKLAGAIGSSFSVVDDGHGGTLIKVAVAGMVQAAASLAPSTAAATPTSSHGGAFGVSVVYAAGSAGGRA